MNQKINEITVLNSGPEEETLFRPIEECLTEKLKEVLSELPPEICDLSLTELEDRLTITPTLSRLKMRFWQEYQRTIQNGRKTIELSTCLEGVCSRQYFFKYVVHRPEMFAWLFHAPTDFDIAAEEALNYGIDKVRKILDAPLFKIREDGSEGEFIPVNASSVLSAVKFLDARVKGSPLQRIEQKSLHLHKSADSAPKGITRDELDAEIKALSQRLGGNTLLIGAPDETE